MPTFERIRDRLPTLYRPERDDAGLLTTFLRASGDALERANADASDVLQAHWFRYADSARFSPYFARARRLLDLPPPDPRNPDDQQALDQFPHIRHLARLAALLPLPPWEQPPALREVVEAYRQRIARTVALYRNGLGTVDALRGMVEAQLPVDLAAPPERRDRGVWLEEFAPIAGQSLAVQQPGPPADMVGPLMAWTVDSDAISAAPPTVYVQGVTPQTGQIDATTDPVVELYAAGGARPRVGIAYRGTLAPDQTLRLRPAFASWAAPEGGTQGLARAQSVPSDERWADPTAPGPWAPEAGGPPATVVALVQAADRTLWAAANAGGGALWRYDGRQWTAAVSGLAELRCLADDGQSLLAGTATGLLRVPIYPADGDPFAANPVPSLAGRAVNTIFRAADAQLWLGTGQGVVRLGEGDVAEPFVLRQDQGTGTEVFAIAQDRTGALYFGTALGLFQHQPSLDHWYWYAGEASSEQAPEWQPFHPDLTGDARNFPIAGRVFLPPVRCVHRGPDAALWLGTDAGIARYLARSAGANGGLSFETALEAFPDFSTGRVPFIREDDRGIVWFGTDRGLLRYDGRDLWQFQGAFAAGVRAPLGRADTLYGAGPPEGRGSWRFDRVSERWQRFDRRSATWIAFTGGPRTTAGPVVHALTWTDGAAGDLGTWDGSQFTSDTAVDPALLLARVKPNEQRIVAGGIPAAPRVPAGASTWRYLSLEPQDVPVPAVLPAWTVEGRLLPPPPDLDAPPVGRYDVHAPPPSSDFDAAVFAFHPAARVWMAWEARRPLTALVRLKERSTGEHIDPAVLDRIWQGMQQVRPAGVRTLLALEEDVVRGKNDGNAG